MSTEANKVLVRRYRQAHNTNDLALLDEIVAADIKSHNGIPGLPSGLQGGKMVHRTFLAAFPNGLITTEGLIAEGDQVVERFSFRGTNTGPLMHAPATGTKVTFTGVSVFRIANGKIVEHCGAHDAFGSTLIMMVFDTPPSKIVDLIGQEREGLARLHSLLCSKHPSQQELEAWDVPFILSQARNTT